VVAARSKPSRGQLAWHVATAIGLGALAAFGVIAALVIWLEQHGLQQRASAAAKSSVASVQASLGAAVWSMDRNALQLLAEPLVREGSIVRVQVLEGGTPQLDLRRPQVGTADTTPPAANTAASWVVPLYAAGRPEPIGELRVWESYQHLQMALFDHLPTLLGAEALKVALVAAGVLWLVNRRLTRPLRQLAHDVETLDIDQPQARLSLARPANARADELDDLAQSITRLHQRLVDELRRRTEAEQREHAEAAESRAARAADRAKSEFLSRMSHELRTPLNAVLGLSDVLLFDQAQPLAERQRQLLGHVRSAGQHLLRLISDLLDLSRIEAGTMTLHLQTLPVGPMVSECVELVAPAAQAQGIQVQVKADENASARVTVDETRFKQVLMNLLSNAIKYNREGGSVVVTISSDTGLRVSVADTGLGMSAAQLAQLFTPFSRAGRESSRVEGTGIGLVIARHLAMLMGGNLSCSSEEGQGSRFVLQLPLASPQEAALPGAAAATAMPSAGTTLARDDVCGTVLIVEDDDVNRLMLQLYLQYRPGVRTRFAADVNEALAAAASALPQLALIDMNLGPRSGHEVLAGLRAQTGGAAVRCVAFSADALPEHVRAVLAAGFDDYWVKPIGLEDFLRQLDDALGAAAPAVQSMR
jgi:signal transduction histidine kinase/ActR/RegA family two-component response regulator